MVRTKQRGFGTRMVYGFKAQSQIDLGHPDAELLAVSCTFPPFPESFRSFSHLYSHWFRYLADAHVWVD